MFLIVISQNVNFVVGKLSIVPVFKDSADWKSNYAVLRV